MKRLLAFTCLFLIFGLVTAHAGSRLLVNVTWYRIHLGMGGGAASVAPEQMADFLSKEVEPRFPEGMTYATTRGQWRSPEGNSYKERTMVVDVQCVETENCQGKIDELSAIYVERFKKAKASVYVLRIPGISTQLSY